jgi:phytoene synthase
MYTGDDVRDPVDRALSAVVRHVALPRTVLDTLLEGFAWEFDHRRYETLSDLTAYAVRVAGTVGVAVSCLMGRRSAATLARACDLGVAMQLTNIARDVGEDARVGRLYLPRAWMRVTGLEPETWLRCPTFAPAVGEVVRQLLETADRLYRRSEAGIGDLPPRCRLAIRAARLIYADIGRKIAEAGYDSVSRRAFTSGPRKAVLAWRALTARPATPSAPAAEPPLPEAAALVAAVALAADRGTAGVSTRQRHSMLHTHEDSA